MSEAARRLALSDLTRIIDESGNIVVPASSAAIGSLTDPAVTDPTASGSLIALTKGVQTLLGVGHQTAYSLACSANITDGTFDSLVPTTTTPAASSSRAVITIPSGHDNILIVPFGVGTNNTTFDLRLTIWQQTSSNLWIPTPVFTLTGCTLDSALPGVASEVPDETNYFIDGITSSVGIVVQNLSTTADSLIKTFGAGGLSTATYAELTFDMTGATSANALYVTY